MNGLSSRSFDVMRPLFLNSAKVRPKLHRHRKKVSGANRRNTDLINVAQPVGRRHIESDRDAGATILIMESNDQPRHRAAIDPDVAARHGPAWAVQGWLSAMLRDYHLKRRGPSAAPARVHRTIVPPYQTATKGNESALQCKA